MKCFRSVLPEGKNYNNSKEFKKIDNIMDWCTTQITDHIMNSNSELVNQFLAVLIDHKIITPEKKKELVGVLWGSDTPSNFKILANIFKQFDIISAKIQSDFTALASDKSTLLTQLANKDSRYTIILNELFKSQSGTLSDELQTKLSLKKITETLKTLVEQINKEQLTNKDLSEVKELDFKMILKWSGVSTGVDHATLKEKIDSYEKLETRCKNNLKKLNGVKTRENSLVKFLSRHNIVDKIIEQSEKLKQEDSLVKDLQLNQDNIKEFLEEVKKLELLYKPIVDKDATVTAEKYHRNVIKLVEEYFKIYFDEHHDSRKM